MGGLCSLLWLVWERNNYVSQLCVPIMCPNYVSQLCNVQVQQASTRAFQVRAWSYGAAVPRFHAWTQRWLSDNPEPKSLSDPAWFFELNGVLDPQKKFDITREHSLQRTVYLGVIKTQDRVKSCSTVMARET